MRDKVCNFLIGVVAVGSVMFSTGATANPPGVPVGDPPLSCITVDSKGGGNNYSVTAILGTNGEFPAVVPCDSNDPSQGTCSDYGYTITSLSGVTISQSLFAVSADQDLYGTDPSSFVASPSDGDSTTDFLKYASHEYPIRFNERASTFNAHIYIKGGASVPRIGTAYIRGGKIDETCLIAGPGVAGNPFEQQSVSKQVVAAGGKCTATLHYNGKNEVVSITNVANVDPSDPNVNCQTFQPNPPPGKKFKLNLSGDPNNPLPLQAGVDGRDGITFGTGTTTVYLPSGWAICTSSPCPGSTTYVYW
jgi:hypothetical protein